MNLIPSTDIIKKSIALYKENKDYFAYYVKLLFLPSAITVLLGTIIDFFAGDLRAATPSIVMGIGGIFAFVFFIAAGLVSLWIGIALLRAVAERYDGREARDPKTLLKESTTLIWPVIVASILNGLAVVGGIILFIIPGIIFSIWFAFTMYAVVLDNARGTKALSLSKHLVRGRWWAVFVRLLVPGIAFGLIVLLAQAIIGIPTELILKTMSIGTLPYAFVTLVAGLFTAGISVFVAPLTTAAQAILYAELNKSLLPAKTADAAPVQTP